MSKNIDLEKIAIAAVQKAQVIQKKFFTQAVEVFHKGQIDLVTQADLDSQKVIIDHISQYFPHHRFLAEEDGLDTTQLLKNPTWIIDPLDGTTNFSKRFPYFAISIAFYDENAVQFALILNPMTDDYFIAHKNKGAYKNGQALHVSSVDQLDQAFMVTGFPYDRRSSPHNNLNEFRHMELKTLCVRRTGAAALDLAYIAAGVFDGFWELKLKPWDIAAGMLLVEEAGGKVTDYNNKPIVDLWKQEIIAANAPLHDQIMTELHKVGDLNR